jgi:hypothetical protein
MKRSLIRRWLLASASITVLAASPAWAQQDECAQRLDQVEQELQSADLADQRRAEVQGVVDGARTLAETGDPDGCLRVVAELESLMQTLDGGTTAQAGQEPQAGEQEVPAGEQQTGAEQMQTGAEQQQEQAQTGEAQMGEAEATTEVTAQLQVQQPQPRVTVRQQAPKITVHVPAPQITIQMPEPQVDVQMVEPEVTVEMGQPQLQVSEAQTEVEGHQQEQQQAAVTVEQAEPEVEVRQEEPQIQIARAGGQQGQDGERQRMTADQQPAAAADQPQDQGEQQMAAEEQPEEPVAEQQVQSEEPAVQQQAETEQPQIATDHPLAAMPASEVIGADVVNAEGENVAEVVDLVKQQGQDDLYAVLSVGGFLGIGQKKVIVPITELEVTQDGEIMMANATQEQLKEMPEYQEEGYDSQALLQ